MFTIDEKNPLKAVSQVSYLLFALLRNLPKEELNKLTLQRINHPKRKTLMWKLHLLNCAVDRAERGVLPTVEDEKANRVEPVRRHYGDFSKCGRKKGK